MLIPKQPKNLSFDRLNNAYNNPEQTRFNSLANQNIMRMNFIFGVCGLAIYM